MLINIIVVGLVVGFFVVIGGLLTWDYKTSSHQPAPYCFDGQVYVPTPYGTVLQGDQQVCIGPMTGPSKKGLD